MSETRVRVALACLAVATWMAATADLPSQTPELQWYKGNLHTHTINSDGDSAPDSVARWYKENRYQFLALTDHNYFTDPQGLNSVLAANDRFLLITGEEVTSGFGDAPVHVNAFRLGSTIEPASGQSVLETLQANVDTIRAANAVPSLNHPSFRWAVSSDVLRRARNLGLFEVFNGIRDTNDEWGLEAMWDAALTAGREMYGIAVDDAHEFKQWGPERSNPGRGWVQVRASELSEPAILSSLQNGDFYASTGVTLSTLERGGGQLQIQMETIIDERFRTQFIGQGGRILKEVNGTEASYQLQPGDRYVRATVRDSAGRRAWVQPVFAE